MNIYPMHLNDIDQLEHVEQDAERRYDEAIRSSDNDAAAIAARDWIQASARLDAYLDAYLPADQIQPQPTTAPTYGVAP